jgi:hypothetical protein
VTIEAIGHRRKGFIRQGKSEYGTLPLGPGTYVMHKAGKGKTLSGTA